MYPDDEDEAADTFSSDCEQIMATCRGIMEYGRQGGRDLSTADQLVAMRLLYDVGLTLGSYRMIEERNELRIGRQELLDQLARQRGESVEARDESAEPVPASSGEPRSRGRAQSGRPELAGAPAGA